MSRIVNKDLNNHRAEASRTAVVVTLTFSWWPFIFWTDVSCI